MDQAAIKQAKTSRCLQALQPLGYHCRKEDPVGWLRFQKRRWRETAAARKKRRIEAAQQRDREPSRPQPAARGKLAFSLA